MKVLYTKTNSERAKRFQLQTIIYEDNGKRFVTKKALSKESIVHLKNMKRNYEKLSNSIIDPKIKLAKIVSETENTLTFEYIDGISLEKKYNDKENILDLYKEILYSGFKTTTFDSNSMVNDKFKQLFGDMDYSSLDGELCFKDISNIDIIFSNILLKDEDIYIIDYEWTFYINIPINYVIYRQTYMFTKELTTNNQSQTNNTQVYKDMEQSLIQDTILDGFYKSQHLYLKPRYHISILDKTIQDQKDIIQNKNLEIQHQKDIIEEQNRTILSKNAEVLHWHDIAHELRLKNRLKRVLKTEKLKKVFHIIKTIQENPHLLKKGLFYIKRGEFKYLISKAKEKSSPTSTEVIDTENYYKEYFKNFDYHEFDECLKSSFDIVIPVYNGIEYLQPLFDSIKKNTSINYRLIVINDASPDKDVKPLLLKILKDFNHIFIDNEQNLGFVQSVNKAVGYVKNHFVILNTDTEVPSYWLRRLMYPIITQDNIASTTPFTNSGTIASFPNFLQDNKIFNDLSVEELDSYFKIVDPKNNCVEIPTGVGFCMGINYDLVKKIGFFDEKTFNKGYGEENDWCQRAIKNNFQNIMVPNLFVYHKHGGSFLSEDKKRYIEENLQKLLNKHPDYQMQVDKFIKEDPYRLLRELLIVLISSNKDGVYIIVDHLLGGGANIYRNELIDKYKKENKEVILLGFDFYKNRYEISYKNDTHNIKIHFDKIIDLKDYLSILDIKELFVNELVSYPNVIDMINLILDIKKQNKADMIIPIHDYFSICPSYTLLNKDGDFCNVPSDINVCEKCINKNNLEWKTFFRADVDMIKWRNEWNKVLSSADKILCFSNSSKELVLKAYPNVNTNSFHVIPHKIKDLTKIVPKNKTGDYSKTVAVLGAINFAKGSSIIKDLIKIIEKENLNINIVLIGEISTNISSTHFKQTGRYNKEDLPNIIIEHEVDIFLIPSIWPETFSYTTQEIISMDMPLMVFNLGAPAERVKHYSKGIVLKDISAIEVLNTIKEI